MKTFVRYIHVLCFGWLFFYGFHLGCQPTLSSQKEPKAEPSTSSDASLSEPSTASEQVNSSERSTQPDAPSSPERTTDLKETQPELIVDTSTPLPTFTKPLRLEPGKGSSNVLLQPSVALSAKGHVGLVYTTLGPNKQLVVHFLELDAEGKERAPSVRISSSKGSQNEPSICALAQGGYVAAWSVDTKASSQNLEIHFRILDSNGKPVGTQDTRVQTERTGNHWLAKVACDPRGGFAITGVRPDIQDKTFDVFFRRYNAQGQSTGAAVATHHKGEGTQAYPVIGVGPQGRTYVAWEDEVQSIQRVVLRIFSQTGAATPEISVLGTKRNPSKSAQIAVHPQSGIVLVSASTQGGKGIALIPYSKTGRAQPKWTLHDTGKAIYNVSIVALKGSSNFAAVYFKDTGTTREVRLALLGPNSTQLPAVTLYSAKQLPPYKPSISYANGRLAIAWTDRKTTPRTFSIHTFIFTLQ